jgi:hypothetical protein
MKTIKRFFSPALSFIMCVTTPVLSERVVVNINAITHVGVGQVITANAVAHIFIGVTVPTIIRPVRQNPTKPTTPTKETSSSSSSNTTESLTLEQILMRLLVSLTGRANLDLMLFFDILKSRYKVSDELIDDLRLMGLSPADMAALFAFASQMIGGLNEENLRLLLSLYEQFQGDWISIAKYLGLNLNFLIIELRMVIKAFNARYFKEEKKSSTSSSSQNSGNQPPPSGTNPPSTNDPDPEINILIHLDILLRVLDLHSLLFLDARILTDVLRRIQILAQLNALVGQFNTFGIFALVHANINARILQRYFSHVDVLVIASLLRQYRVGDVIAVLTLASQLRGDFRRNIISILGLRTRLFVLAHVAQLLHLDSRLYMVDLRRVDLLVWTQVAYLLHVNARVLINRLTQIRVNALGYITVIPIVIDRDILLPVRITHTTTSHHMREFTRKSHLDTLKNVRDIRSLTQDIRSQVRDVQSVTRDVRSQIRDVQLVTRDIRSQVRDITLETRQIVQDARGNIREIVQDTRGIVRDVTRDVSSTVQDVRQDIRNITRDTRSEVRNIVNNTLKDARNTLRLK